MSYTSIIAENLSKAYILGEISTGTVYKDLERWWAKKRGKQDPFWRLESPSAPSANNEMIWSLRDLNFEIKNGDTVGIIGRNGAGKSTLFKILSRVTLPTTGRVRIRGRIASLLEVGTGFHPDLTGRENIFLNGAIMGMRKAEIRQKMDEIIDFAGVSKYIDTPVKRYSSGMTVRLAFAVAANLDSEILIVDEVLAVGDAEFQKKCLGKISDVSKKQGRTVLFVSHNTDAVLQLCKSAMLLQNGRMMRFADTRDVVHQYIHENSMLIIEDQSTQLFHPVIRRVEIDPQSISKGHFRCFITFESPFIIQHPNITMVMKTATGNPVFSSSFKRHSATDAGRQIKNGKATIDIKDIPLYSGLYSISIYLGDETQHFDEKQDCLLFELTSGTNGIINQDINIMGPAKIPASWVLE